MTLSSGYGHVAHDAIDRINRRVIATAVACPIMILVGAWIQPVMTPSALTRDTLAVASGIATKGGACCSPFIGAVSNAGLFVWAGAAAICIFGALFLRLMDVGGIRRTTLAIGAVHSAWLLLDDAFMLHETLGFKILGTFGAFNLVNFVLLLVVTLCLSRTASAKNLSLFAVAIGLFAASFLIDKILPQGQNVIFFEDAFKFSGICLWAAFWMLKVIEFLKAAIDDRRTGSTGKPGQPRDRHGQRRKIGDEEDHQNFDRQERQDRLGNSLDPFARDR